MGSEGLHRLQSETRWNDESTFEEEKPIVIIQGNSALSPVGFNFIFHFFQHRGGGRL